MHFCPNCSSLLRKNVESEPNQANVDLLFVCEICAWSQPAGAEDTLMSSVSLREEQSLYKSEIYLNLAAKDKIAPIVRKQCTACDCDRLRKVHLIATGETVFVCTSCENRFL
jgi:DNA-directed RNA polymerase subunit M/transcription elongation factor TFIIS